MQSEQNKLENEMQLQFRAYSQVAAQLQLVFHKERHLIPLLTFDDDEEDYGEITLTDLARILKSDQNIV
jgi:hypothetical protein